MPKPEKKGRVSVRAWGVKLDGALIVGVWKDRRTANSHVWPPRGVEMEVVPVLITEVKRG